MTVPGTSEPRARSWCFALLAATLLFAVACDDSSTDPGDLTLLFEGVVEFQGEEFHVFETAEQGTVRINLDDLSPLLLDVTFTNPDALVVTVGVGFVNEGACQETTNFTLREFDELLFGLAPDEYCVSIADAGVFPEDAQIRYVLSVQLPVDRSPNQASFHVPIGATMNRTLAILLLAMATLLFAGCSDDDDDPITTEPNDPVDVELVTEVFNGSFGQGGTSFHTFSVAQIGNTEATINALEPVPTLTVGLAVGNVVDGADIETSCVAFASDQSVRAGESFLIAALDPGNYCISVFDVGNVFPDATVSYELTVVHP